MLTFEKHRDKLEALREGQYEKYTEAYNFFEDASESRNRKLVDERELLNWRENVIFTALFGFIALSFAIGFCKIIAWTYEKVCVIF